MSLEMILISVAVLVAVAAAFFLLTNKKKNTDRVETIAQETPEAAVNVVIATPKKAWHERLVDGLSRSRDEVWGKIASILGKDLDEGQLEQVEELLYTADMAPKTIEEIIEALREGYRKGTFDPSNLSNFLFNLMKEKLSPIQSKIQGESLLFNPDKKVGTKVIMIVGVNGAGKTTTIGKLATRLKNQGATVLVGACDTFRAAAVEQLKVWCDRAGVEMVRAADGADPSGVAFDSLKKAQEIQADYCLIDTAGRLHTYGHLMDELKKTKKVLSKLDPSAPHETWLVIDAITGQNAMKQAEEFNKALELSGLIFTKCDGSAKAGSGVSIIEALQVPICYIGVGETVEDLNVFDLDEYLGALLGKR